MRERRSAPVVPESTGSVYLDAPRPSRHRTLPLRRAHGSRTVAAAVLGIVGLTALTALMLAVGVRALVAEPSSVAEAVGAALDEPVAREELEHEIADAIVRDLVGADISDAVAAFGVDVQAEAAAVAAVVLDDPGFRAALDDLVTEVHRRVLVETDPTDLDFGPLTDAAVAVIETESPVLAAVVPADGTLASVKRDSLPDLTGNMSFLEQATIIAALASLATPLAAVIHPRRHHVLSWLGRWLLTAGLATAVLAVTLPYLGGRFTGWATVEAAVRSSTLRLLAPAAIAGIVGMGLVSVASVAKNRERRRIADEGAAAALGVDEPPLYTAPAAPNLDIGRLVDAGRPLTNI